MALACDLGLDRLPCCAEAHKWAWFRRYCNAARVAIAMVKRMLLPGPFTEEVLKKIQDIASEGSVLVGAVGGAGSRMHERHDIFKQEHDEQLLQWINRFAHEDSLSHSNNFITEGYTLKQHLGQYWAGHLIKGWMDLSFSDDEGHFFLECYNAFFYQHCLLLLLQHIALVLY